MYLVSNTIFSFPLILVRDQLGDPQLQGNTSTEGYKKSVPAMEVIKGHSSSIEERMKPIMYKIQDNK